MNNGHAQGLTATDPSFVFLIKSLLYPVVAVGSLAVSLACWNEPFSGPYFLLAVMTFLVSAYMLDVADLYYSVRFFPLLRCFFDVVFHWVLILGLLWVVVKAAGIRSSMDDRVLLTWAIFTPALLLGAQIGARVITLRFSQQRERVRKTVIVGVTELGMLLAKQLREDPLLGAEFLGFFEERDDARLPDGCNEIIRGKTDALVEYIAAHDVSVVYITLPMTRHPRILDLLEKLRDSTVSIYFVPDLFVFDLIQARFDFIHGIPLVAVRESPFYGVRSILKRLSDIVIACLILLAIWPVLLMVALGVKLTSAGPAIFKQRRYGLDGKEILVYKFRSMTVTEDGDKTYKQVTKNDLRVTPFGAFIRKTSLDELPQFFNVLEGSMSIVGPRPHAVAVNEQYRKLIPGYMVRHKVKPGITGWAQVNGFRGGDDLDSMTSRIRYDLEYLRNWSLGLDLSIIFKTFFVFFGDKSAY